MSKGASHPEITSREPPDAGLGVAAGLNEQQQRGLALISAIVDGVGAAALPAGTKTIPTLDEAAEACIAAAAIFMHFKGKRYGRSTADLQADAALIFERQILIQREVPEPAFSLRRGDQLFEMEA